MEEVIEREITYLITLDLTSRTSLKLNRISDGVAPGCCGGPYPYGVRTKGIFMQWTLDWMDGSILSDLWKTDGYDTCG